MAVTVTNYGLFLQSLVEGRVNLASDEIWCMLVTNAYVFNQHTHKFKSVVTGELVGSGYTAGGKKVTFTAPTYDSASKSLSVASGNLAWPVVTFAGAVGAVVYSKPLGSTDGIMPLISYISFGEAIARTAQAFYINWPTTGVLRMLVP
jgi:hypothetical protein